MGHFETGQKYLRIGVYKISSHNEVHNESQKSKPWGDCKMENELCLAEFDVLKIISFTDSLRDKLILTFLLKLKMTRQKIMGCYIHDVDFENGCIGNDKYKLNDTIVSDLKTYLEDDRKRYNSKFSFLFATTDFPCVNYRTIHTILLNSMALYLERDAFQRVKLQCSDFGLDINQLLS